MTTCVRARTVVEPKAESDRRRWSASAAEKQGRAARRSSGGQSSSICTDTRSRPYCLPRPPVGRLCLRVLQEGEPVLPLALSGGPGACGSPRPGRPPLQRLTQGCLRPLPPSPPPLRRRLSPRLPLQHHRRRLRPQPQHHPAHPVHHRGLAPVPAPHPLPAARTPPRGSPTLAVSSTLLWWPSVPVTSVLLPRTPSGRLGFALGPPSRRASYPRLSSARLLSTLDARRERATKWLT